MLKFRKKRFGIIFHYRWFADRPVPSSAFKPMHYMQCASPGNPLLGFVNRKITVRVVDLRQEDEQILAGMKSRTRTDIRRAQREGVEIHTCTDKREFLDFYNEFAVRKSDHLSRLDNQIHWGEDTLVQKAVHDGNVLVMNHFIVDKADGRARMMYSAAKFRGVDSSEDRNRVGRSSRHIHYEMMLHCKRMGLHTYDFGEYDVDTDDESLKQVNRFKACFGGFDQECYKVQTLPMFLLSKGYELIRRTKGAAI